VGAAAPYKSGPALTFMFFYYYFKFDILKYLLDADEKSSRELTGYKTYLVKVMHVLSLFAMDHIDMNIVLWL
jgi:hypothetical protein